jgi:hypothetical protein
MNKIFIRLYAALLRGPHEEATILALNGIACENENCFVCPILVRYSIRKGVNNG